MEIRIPSSKKIDFVCLISLDGRCLSIWSTQIPDITKPPHYETGYGYFSYSSHLWYFSSVLQFVYDLKVTHLRKLFDVSFRIASVTC